MMCTRAPFAEMEGQLSLFPEEQEPSVKMKTQREKKRKEIDPSQTFEERRKRFWHYMDMKGMNEQYIETAEGELRIVVDALADYHDIVSRKIEEMEGYAKAVWEIRLEKIKQIQAKVEQSIGYDRDRQLEACRKRRPPKDDDIGEDAVVLAARGKKADKKGKDGTESGNLHEVME